MITLDVRNVFNSAPWDAIDAAIRRKNVLEYFSKMLRYYMSGREVIVPDSDHCRDPRIAIIQNAGLQQYI